ncbi:MAG TPA: site-2 protease family protein [Chloroflexi bacterium]|jgi:Zn-dependent protease|nr:site-2 protease family protein [Chloroflexota bacterium]
MNHSLNSLTSRFRQDRIFWIIIATLGVAYLLLVAKVGLQFVFVLLGLLMAITVHEFSHAWSANYLGDPTARFLGRVSLNPLRHLDPMGTVMMLITTLTGVGIGWGKPVPVTPYRLRYGSRRGHALVALAGPASNLILATALGLIVRAMVALLPPLMESMAASTANVVLVVFDALWIIAQTNIVIAVFNLLPIPPLDGHAVLLGALSFSRSQLAWRISTFIERIAAMGPMLFIGILIITQLLGLNLLGALIMPPTRWLSRIILGL